MARTKHYAPSFSSQIWKIYLYKNIKIGQGIRAQGRRHPSITRYWCHMSKAPLSRADSALCCFYSSRKLKHWYVKLWDGLQSLNIQQHICASDRHSASWQTTGTLKLLFIRLNKKPQNKREWQIRHEMWQKRKGVTPLSCSFCWLISRLECTLHIFTTTQWQLRLINCV